MKNDRLKLIFSIVDEAIDLNPKERDDFLRHRCEDDEIMQQEVTSLMKAMTDSEGFWNDWISWKNINFEQLTLRAESSVPSVDATVPDIVGPWKIIKPLGRGGMAAVYLAQRADGTYDRKIALKILDLGLDHDDAIRRFGQEQKILAKLDHPGIARLFDAGLDENGRPWIAMEYVDGITITDWCRNNNASLSDRLTLFLQLCNAVQYAHKNLVVHRDLKPDNILVTTSHLVDDDVVAPHALVKVLDFGIAKLLDEELPVSGLHHTRPGLRPLSLSYAAPEQINGEPITTATDVYALGLILYELLTDSHAFNFAGKNYRTIQNIILNQHPERPGSVSVEWRKHVKGDLDAITLKALRKEPDQRYDGAGQLMEDILRYKNHRAVSAHKGYFSYKSKKFIRRNLKMISLIFLLISGSIVTAVYHTRQLTIERDLARIEANKSERISSFLKDLFNAADPNIATGDTVTVYQLLERGSERIDLELDTEPELKADMLHTIGVIYSNLGRYPESRNHLEQALLIREKSPGPANRDLIESLNSLAKIAMQQSRFDDAEMYLERVKSYMGILTESDHEQLATHLSNMAAIYIQRSIIDKAESNLRESIHIRKNILSENSNALANNMDGLSMVLQRKQGFAEAESLNIGALHIRELILKPDHPDLGRSHNNLATLYYRQNNYQNAEIHFRKTLDIWSKVYGRNHPDLALVLNNLAAVHEKMGNLDDAEIMYRESLAIKEQILDKNHISIARSLTNLGILLKTRERYDEALEMLHNSLQIRMALFGEHHIEVIQANHTLAAAYEQSGQYEQAAHYFKTELNSRFITSPDDLHAINRSRLALGKCLTELNRFNEAETYLLDGYLLTENNTDQIELRSRYMNQLDQLYTAWDQPDKASSYRVLISEN